MVDELFKSNKRPSMCTLIPSSVWQEISAPGTKEIPGRNADCASKIPATESWSVNAIVVTPAASALFINSLGESVPSL